MLIPKNTSVLIRRIPGHSPKPIVAVPVTEPDEPKRINELDTTQQAKSNFSGAGFSAPNYPLDGSEYDEFGNHLTYLANRQKPGCAKGTGVDRSRTSATVSLKKKFKDKMSEFQHDERARQVGRSYRHRETTEREPWKDLKDRQRGRAIKRGSNNDNDTKPRDEQQPSKRRPSFRETKLPVNAGTGDKSATMEEAKKIPWSERKEESRKPPLMDRPDRHRTEMQRMNFQSRDGYGGSSLRGRDRLNGQSGGRADKWKHDLFDETSNNQTSNKEEDQIAKGCMKDGMGDFVRICEG